MLVSQYRCAWDVSAICVCACIAIDHTCANQFQFSMKMESESEREREEKLQRNTLVVHVKRWIDFARDKWHFLCVWCVCVCCFAFDAFRIDIIIWYTNIGTTTNGYYCWYYNINGYDIEIYSIWFECGSGVHVRHPNNPQHIGRQSNFHIFIGRQCRHRTDGPNNGLDI